MRHIILALALSAAFCPLCSGQRLAPAWLGNPPKAPSSDVAFVCVSGVGVLSTNGAVPLSLDKLTAQLPREWEVASELTTADSTVINRKAGRLSGSSETQVSTLHVMAKGQPVNVKCMLVDEYFSPSRAGAGYEYSALYQVARPGCQSLWATRVTDDYGMLPLCLSIIPGAGQLYKKDTVKGCLLMAGCAAGVAGTFFFEGRRAKYAAQMKQTLDVNVLRTLSAKQENMKVARTVTLSITAALYVYNLFDAALVPGARRVIVSPEGVRINF